MLQSKGRQINSKNANNIDHG
eukprot:SAG31_NODE_39010_length_291_cov_1.192708_1_plen_20_part_10